MEIISLKCNSCGSDLKINDDIKFFKCSFCNSSLALKKSGNAIYTEVLDEIKANTDTILDNSEKLLLEKQLDRLDREWEKEAEEYKDVAESRGFPFVLIVTIMVFMFIASIVVSKIDERNPVNPLHSAPDTNNILMVIFGFGFLFIIGIIVTSIMTSHKKEKFDEKERIYQSKRNSLLNKIK